jgi:hypothetical protein
MVTGLECFRNYFKDFSDGYVLIGGVACELILDSMLLPFRPTNDFDLVVVAENLQYGFGAKLKQFIHDGKYAVGQRKSKQQASFFRFLNPKTEGFPQMLELASNKPAENWIYHFAPLDIGDGKPSLSAILFDADYYSFICENSVSIRDLSVISLTGIIPLKALAFEELTRSENPAEKNLLNIEKHLDDIFVFANLLPDTPKPLPAKLRKDLATIMALIEQRDLSAERLELAKHIRQFYGCAESSA